MAHSYRLTIRHGSRVSTEGFDSLDAALVALEAGIEEVRRAGDLPPISVFRDYDPAQRVAARLEISAGGLRGRTAGVDVQGDGTMVPFRGAVIRKLLEAEGSDVGGVLRDALAG